MTKRMNYLLTLFMVFTIMAASAQAEETYQYYSANKKAFTPIQIVKFKEIKLSSSCVKDSVAKCQAWSAVQKKAQDPDRKGIPLTGNPAALYCASYKSKNIIFLDSKKKEYDYCLFSDNSAVDAWDLYYKHHK